MLLCTETETIFRDYGAEAGTALLAEAGYDCLDLSLFEMSGNDSPFVGENYREVALAYRRYAEANNLTYYQAHAPFTWTQDKAGARSERFFERVARSIEIASLVGSSCIVVHPVPVDDPEKQTEWNVNYYRRLLKLADEYEITVLTENMWGIDKKRNYIVSNVLSYGRELAAFFDLIDHPRFGVCLDLGHCGLVGEDADVAIRALGRDRLTALHVHDNDHLHDTHTMPYLGKMDWDAITQALGAIDYQGVFTLEADAFLWGFPPALYPQASKLMVETARHLMEKVDAARPA